MVGTISPHIGLSSISNPPCWAHIKKALQQKAKGLEIDKLPQQNDFRTFYMNNDTEKVYQKLEEVIGVCWELKKAKTSIKKSCLLILLAPQSCV